METTQDIGDSRLMALADVLDQTNRYDQGDGTVCAYGHYRRHIRDFIDLKAEFHIDTDEMLAIFSSSGCGDARRDNKKAARYIREFVARRNPVVKEELTCQDTCEEVEDEGLLGGGESAKQDACVTV